MKIDTTYPKIDSVQVTMRLESEEERALTDDLLARIGANQNRLQWVHGADGTAMLAADPATFRLPLSRRSYTVARSSIGVATVTYQRPKRFESALIWGLAASLAIGFGSTSLLRFNDAMHIRPANYPTANT